MEVRQVNGSDLPHGHKRHAEDELENDQRLTKRFNLLDLERDGKLYIPVKQPVSEKTRQQSGLADAMQVDSTSNRIYIYDIDDELSDIESNEEKLVFLPDIEKKLSKLPRSVLEDPNDSAINQQLVLYNIPESLSLPRENDNVRKAIIETRARAREKQAQELGGSGLGDDDRQQSQTPTRIEDPDPDMMDIE
ncbi:hypothetical protein MMC09_004964 [Bachmanniomyces sp. S44760]|nr:hypothetical protein [Bachmanniomyces sp. S44760]